MHSKRLKNDELNKLFVDSEKSCTTYNERRILSKRLIKNFANLSTDEKSKHDVKELKTIYEKAGVKLNNHKYIQHMCKTMDEMLNSGFASKEHKFDNCKILRKSLLMKVKTINI